MIICPACIDGNTVCFLRGWKSIPTSLHKGGNIVLLCKYHIFNVFKKLWTLETNGFSGSLRGVLSFFLLLLVCMMICRKFPLLLHSKHLIPTFTTNILYFHENSMALWTDFGTLPTSIVQYKSLESSRSRWEDGQENGWQAKVFCYNLNILVFIQHMPQKLSE